MNADDDPHHPHWLRGFVRVGGYILFAGVLYVVGYGPVGYLLRARAPAVDRALIFSGRPVDWLIDNTSWGRPLLFYYLWWNEFPGGPQDRVRKGYVYPSDP